MKKRSRKLRKVLLVTCCALALVAISVGATLAYLTDNESVTNTFTVGQVGISLDETDTDNSTQGENDRDTANKYHLIPGQTYIKDPIVHVDADSESSWIFVKVVNGIADIEVEGETSIAWQMDSNGWTQLFGVDNVWCRKYLKGHTDRDLEVFGYFVLKGDKLVNGNADAAKGEVSIDRYANATVKVTAYAIQMAGFDTAKEAWEAGQFN